MPFILEVNGLANVRDLGGLERTDGSLTPTGAFVRAEMLDRVDAEGWDALRSHGVRTVIDLRRPDEITGNVPDDFHVARVDLDGDERDFWAVFEEDGRWGTPLYYDAHLRQLPHRLASVLQAIASAPEGAILFHCGAGWDRTGLVAAVLLKAAGVTEDAAVSDYVASFANADAMSALHDRSFEVEARVAILERFGHTAESAFRAMYRELDVNEWMRVAAIDPQTQRAIATWRTMSRPHAYTHGHHSSVLRSHNRRTVADSAAYLLPHLHPDASLLDIGAGPGSITADFATRVAHVTATEIGEDELALSRSYAAERGIENIAFSVQDVHALDFADDSFDVVHAHQVLQHVADPVQALREMARVTRPGGVVAARDADYAGFIWYPVLPELDEWLHLYRVAARANGGEPDAGRRLLAWARAAGLEEVTATGSAWSYSSPEDRAWWGGMWADRIVESALARQLVDSGLADAARLRSISAAWRAWAESDDGWILIPHGEIVWLKPEVD